MRDPFVPVGDGFWNHRGSFKLAGLIDVGTQASLVQCSDGDFVLLDSCGFDDRARQQLRALTDDGRRLRAILHLHPFHTVHVVSAAQAFPQARLYGTERHVARAPELPWESLRVDDPALHAQFEADLRFSVPDGVDLVSDNEAVHFASVLAFHPRSQALHVDDTLSYLNVPLLGGVRFHPTLRWALQPRAGAAVAFRNWAHDLVERCRSVRHLCTAHGRQLPPAKPIGESFAPAVRTALAKVERTLAKHQRRHG